VGQTFGFWLLTATGPRTLSMYRRETSGRSTASKGQFQADASRFHKLLPKELRTVAPLVRWWPLLDRNGFRVPAYRVLLERSTIVIAGTDPACDPTGVAVDWPTFLVPPTGVVAQPAVSTEVTCSPGHAGACTCAGSACPR
jgi:hypothetical protein